MHHSKKQGLGTSFPIPRMSKMPLLSRRCAVEKSSLRSLNALPSKAFRAFDPTRGGLPPPRAPPPILGRIRLNRGFSTSCKKIAALGETLIKKFSKIGGQQHGTSVSCCCFSAVLRGQVDFSDKIVMYVNLLYPVSAGLVRGMDNDFLHKLMQE